MNKKFLPVVLASLLLTFSFLTAGSAYAQCNNTPPSNLSATRGNNGQVMLSWNQPDQVSQFALVYGLNPNMYQFGMTPIHSVMRSYTVNDLNPGSTYYFQIWSFCDNNGPAYKSNEVSAMGSTPMTTTTMQTSQMTTQPTPAATTTPSPTPNK